jgi:hypothetical protein
VIREKSGRGEEERDERQEGPQAAFEAAVGARGRKQRGRRCPPAHDWLLLMLAQAAKPQKLQLNKTNERWEMVYRPAVGAASGGGQGWSGAARALNGLEAVHRRRHFAPRPHLAPLVDPKMHISPTHSSSF